MSIDCMRLEVLYQDDDVGYKPMIIPRPNTAGSDEFYVGTFL